MLEPLTEAEASWYLRHEYQARVAHERRQRTALLITGLLFMSCCAYYLGMVL